MSTQAINRETVSGEALFILRNLKENGRLGRSNKLAEVKIALEPSVSLEFDTYFFFLRKFHYIAMDREAQIRLTEEGEQVVDGQALDKFGTEVDQFFFDQLQPEPGEAEPESAQPADELPEVTNPVGRPPPPPEYSLDPEALPPPPPPPPAPPVRAAPRRTPAITLTDEPLVPVMPQVSAPSPAPREVPEPKREVSLPPLPPAPAAAMPPPPAAPAPSSAAPATPAPVSGAKGSELDVRYVKFDPLGSGPLGTVFKGRHNALGVDVCIKELKDIFGYFTFLQRSEVIKRLKKELCAQAQVRHPNVVAVLDQNTDVARPFFVMELLKGSLRERLDVGGGKGLPVSAAIRHFLQLSYALKAAHAQGLVHHNIKPENVLFDAFGNVKLGDFGLSRVVEVDQSKGMPQVFVGTGGMAYLAPELLARVRDAGPAADVYSLGILLYEMLTGQLPGRRSPLPSEVNEEVPSKLDPIFDKMTQDRLQNRYPDFDAMLQDFYGAFSDGEYLGRGDLILWSEPPPKA